MTHPNVCRVFDLQVHTEREQETSFLTMELVQGETLSARLRRQGPLAPEEALPLVRQMAAGLQAAHEAGVVHRDFKSGNVMLEQQRTASGKRRPAGGDQPVADRGPVSLGRGEQPTPEGETPATGRTLTSEGAVFSRLNAQGEVVEERRYYDVAGVLAQLGLSA